MNISQLKNNAKEKLNGKFGDLLLCSSIASIIKVVSNIIPGIGMLLVSGPISYGLEKIYEDASNGKNVDWKDLFKFFKDRWGKTLYLQTSAILFCWPTLVCLIASSILSSIVGGVGSALSMRLSRSYSGVLGFLAIGTLVGVIGIIASIVLSIIRSTQTVMSNYVLLREPELDGKQAVQKSVSYMTGHVFEYIWLNITLILYYISNIFFNYGEPMITMTKIDYYASLYNNAPSLQLDENSCPSCGAPISKNAKFCTKCGNKID